MESLKLSDSYYYTHEQFQANKIRAKGKTTASIEDSYSTGQQEHCKGNAKQRVEGKFHNPSLINLTVNIRSCMAWVPFRFVIFSVHYKHFRLRLVYHMQLIVLQARLCVKHGQKCTRRPILTEKLVVVANVRERSSFQFSLINLGH